MVQQFSLEERIGFLKQHGSHAMAFSTLQPGMEYFDVPGVGYIAYMPYRPFWGLGPRRNLVLSDPIASKDNQPQIIREFLAANRSASFLQISRDIAGFLSREQGLLANEMGIETDIPLPEFHTRGKDKSQLRHWLNKAKKEGVTVFEAGISSLNRTDVERVSADWLNRKGGEEARVLTRPLVYDSEPDVRYFWAKQDGELIGMVGFDPMYQGGEIISYYHNVVRLMEEAPTGTSDLITISAMEKFREEGVPSISLGMSPLCKLDDGDFKHSEFLHKVLSFMYSHCNYIYPFKGNHFHKDKYRGQEKKIYFASTHGSNLGEVLIMLGGLNLPIFPSIKNLFREKKEVSDS